MRAVRGAVLRSRGALELTLQTEEFGVMRRVIQAGRYRGIRSCVVPGLRILARELRVLIDQPLVVQ